MTNQQPGPTEIEKKRFEDRLEGLRLLLEEEEKRQKRLDRILTLGGIALVLSTIGLVGILLGA